MWMSCRIGSLHDPFGASVAGLCTVMSLSEREAGPGYVVHRAPVEDPRLGVGAGLRGALLAGLAAERLPVEVERLRLLLVEGVVELVPGGAARAEDAQVVALELGFDLDPAVTALGLRDGELAVGVGHVGVPLVVAGVTEDRAGPRAAGHLDLDALDGVAVGEAAHGRVAHEQAALDPPAARAAGVDGHRGGLGHDVATGGGRRVAVGGQLVVGGVAVPVGRGVAVLVDREPARAGRSGADERRDDGEYSEEERTAGGHG